MEEKNIPSEKTPVDVSENKPSEKKVSPAKDDSFTVAEIDWQKRYLDLHKEFEDHKKSSFSLIILLLICATIIIPLALQLKMNVGAPILPARHLFEQSQTVQEEFERGHIRFENRDYEIRTLPATPSSHEYQLDNLQPDMDVPAAFIE